MSQTAATTSDASHCSPLPTVGPLGEAVRQAFEDSSPLLRLVETRIRSRFVSDASALTEISEYLLGLGGKRIRPVLSLLSYRLFGLEEPKAALIDTAAGIELIHMATLLHDDIIDESPLRRKQPSAYRKFGIPPSLLAGDFLLVRAFGLCAHLDDFIVDATERACIELTEGEVLEGVISPTRKPTLESYLTIVRKKTSSLFALACATGAHIAEAGPRNTELLREFGENAGTAFQMVDDILDIVADEDLLGKPAGTDLRQKTPSLVNILWLESGDDRAVQYFTRETPTMDDAKDALRYLQSTSIISHARHLAKNYASKANSALLMLEGERINARVRDHLFALVEYTLERCL